MVMAVVEVTSVVGRELLSMGLWVEWWRLRALMVLMVLMALMGVGWRWRWSPQSATLASSGSWVMGVLMRWHWPCSWGT